MDWYYDISLSCEIVRKFMLSSGRRNSLRVLFRRKKCQTQYVENVELKSGTITTIARTTYQNFLNLFTKEFPLTNISLVTAISWHAAPSTNLF